MRYRVDPADALLVRDRNGNGLSDDGGELFGNNTELENGKNAANGYSVIERERLLVPADAPLRCRSAPMFRIALSPRLASRRRDQNPLRVW